MAKNQDFSKILQNIKNISRNQDRFFQILTMSRKSRLLDTLTVKVDTFVNKSLGELFISAINTACQT